MSQSPNNNTSSEGWTMAFLAIFIFIMAAAFWQFFKIPIVEFLRWLRLSEFWIISLFTDRHDSCIAWLHATHYGDTNPSEDVIRWANDCFGTAYLARVPRKDLIDYFSLSAPALGALEMIVTYYIHWPLAVIFGGLIIYTMYFATQGKFRTKHTLESFIKVQAKMWPVLTPIVDFNPIHSSARPPGAMVPDKLPLFAEALSPEEWLSWCRIPVTNGIVDREATRRAMVLQLGPRWNGIEGHPPYIRALFAAFALKGAQKREQSDDFLSKISTCWTPKGGFQLTPEIADEVRKLLRDPAILTPALDVAKAHAWRTTALLAVLRWARLMGGVLAPAQFLWLRGVDRSLWYALNNLGRRSFHAEGAGAITHFMVEQNAKKPLPIPRVDTAIVTLNQYLAEKGQPLPPREGDDNRTGSR